MQKDYGFTKFDVDLGLRRNSLDMYKMMATFLLKYRDC